MPVQTDPPVAVLGAGAWGTALALHLAGQGISVRLWTNLPEHAAQMAKQRCNAAFLPGYPFPEHIGIAENIPQAISAVRYVLVAVPSVGFRQTLEQLPDLAADTGMVWVTKGLDISGEMLHEVALQLLGRQRPLAVLSGPSFAGEVAKGLPAAVVIATKHPAFGKQLAKDFTTLTFQTCSSQDLAGVGTGGVVKNVLAIATGISDGLQLGANARCALITQGLAEMTRLGLALGAEAETFTGLAGMGDLVLTATDNQSRNRRLGLAIGSGLSPEQAEKQIGQVVEGKHNARQLTQLAQKHQVSMPITETIWGILQARLSPADAMLALFQSYNS